METGNKLAQGNQNTFGILLRSRSNIVTCETPTQAYKDVLFQKEKEETASEVFDIQDIKEKIKSIRSMLGSMEDGAINISAYDTAWVAMVEDINGSGVPQFPTSLQWVVDNQLPDGSWGDRLMFSCYDRILSTLACVIALKSWKVCPELCEKGMTFIRENISKLEREKEEHMLIGFEVTFPSLLEIAGRQGLQVPTDSPVLQEFYAKRNLKLTKIPMDVVHVMPTSLLYSLEGMAGRDLNWEKLLKLQCQNGSFLTSPASTAFALMQTKDERCLRYLSETVEKFNGGAPTVYPVDLFEHYWAVDRLERLGISRYFQLEIKDCLDYGYRFWTEHGIYWARDSGFSEVDSTAMGFRLLRLHGYEVSPDVFRKFEENGEFFTLARQSSPAVTGIFNLYRASQVLFPEEKILQDAKEFAYKFLNEKQASNQLLDKWIITKDLPGEVGYALDVPWYASLPRIEARFYIDHYGGDDDVWIGKTLYRMHYVNNNLYLDLAKLDFNYCQALHQLEWTTIIQKWYAKCNLVELGVGRRGLLEAYFVAAASIFEPEKANERLAWARVAVLVEAVYLYMEMDTSHNMDQRLASLSYLFNNSNSNGDTDTHIDDHKTQKKLVEAILTTLNCIAWDTLAAHRVDIGHHLQCAWNTWLQNGKNGEGELLVRLINLCAGHLISEEQYSHPQCQRLLQLTSAICSRRRPLINSKGFSQNNNISIAGTSPVEPLMQELVQLVLQGSKSIDSEIRLVFLTIAKSFYYTAHCTSATIDQHIAKVLFNKVA